MQDDCPYYEPRQPLLGDMRCRYWAIPDNHPRAITQFLPHCTHRKVFEVVACPMEIKNQENTCGQL